MPLHMRPVLKMISNAVIESFVYADPMAYMYYVCALRELRVKEQSAESRDDAAPVLSLVDGRRPAEEVLA